MYQKKGGNPKALLPIGVFLVIFIGAGVLSRDFYTMPAIVGFLIALAVAFAQNKRVRFQDKISIISKGIGEENIVTMCLIFLAAGAFSGTIQAAGGVDSTVNLGLSILPSSIAVVGLFVIGCFISVSMGTSVGTITAMAPIGVGIAEKTGIAMPICMGAIVCGAMFGDNLSMISDTTISAAQGCGSEMKDKFRMNFFIALPAAIVALVLYTVLGGQGSGTIEAGAYSVIQVLPYIVVLVSALMGINVALVLFIGILMTGVIGIAQGTVGFFEWIQAIGTGMSDMFSISIVAILISGIIGLVRYYGGVEWMVNAITAKIHSRRSAEYGIGLLSGILSGALVNNTIAIIVTCPIAKEIGGKFGIAPKRLASLVDIFACAFLALMPHDGGILIITELAGCTPLDVLPYSFYMFALIIATCVTIQFGLLRTPEEKAAEKEMSVK